MRNWRASQRFQRKPTLLLLTCVYVVYNQIFFSLDFILSRSWFVLFWFWFYTFDPDKRWKTCFQSYSFFACNNNVRHFGVPFIFAPFALLIASRSAGFRKPFHSSYGEQQEINAAKIIGEFRVACPAMIANDMFSSGFFFKAWFTLNIIMARHVKRIKMATFCLSFSFLMCAYNPVSFFFVWHSLLLTWFTEFIFSIMNSMYCVFYTRNLKQFFTRKSFAKWLFWQLTNL